MGTYDYNAISLRLKQAKEQERARLLASIQGQLNQLEGHISDIDNSAINARSKAYTSARVSAIGNNELLASRGLSGGLDKDPISGVSETSRIAESLNLRSNLTGIDMQRQGQINQVRNQKSALEVNKTAGLSDIEASYENKQAQALQEYEQKRQEQENFERKSAEDKRRWEIEQAFNEQKRQDELRKELDLKEYNEFLEQKKAKEQQLKLDTQNKNELLSYIKSKQQGYAGGATSASTKALDSLLSKLDMPSLGLTEQQKTDYFNYIVDGMGYDKGFVNSYKNWVASGRKVWA